MDNYEALTNVFYQAYDRASVGKGAKRHADGQPFESQPICSDLRTLGIEPAIYQIRKKALETRRFRSKDKKVNELLDVIVYAAAAIIILQEKRDGLRTQRDGL